MNTRTVDGKVSIPISDDVRHKLDAAKRPGETDDEAIIRMMGSPSSKAELLGGIIMHEPSMLNRSDAARIAAFSGDRDALEKIRTVGMNEKVDLRDGSVFFTMNRHEAECILGRPIVWKDGLPLLTKQESRLVEMACQIRESIKDNPKLDTAARLRILSSMRAVSAGHTMTEALSRIGDTIKSEEMMAELIPWVSGPLKLARAQGTALHKLREVWKSGNVAAPAGDDFTRDPSLDMKAFDVDYQVFVIEHDWAAAFKGAKDFEGGEIALPYSCTAFEFYISGKRVITLMIAPDDAESIACVPVVQTSTGRWAMPWAYEYKNGRMLPTGSAPMENPFVAGFQRVADIIGETVRAVCISLEAEIAETTVVRAPHKMNHQRERKGKPPILDYHHVSLARRSRAPRLERDPNAEPGPKKRLHFRRGHYRHFPTFKTWIKWCLVGDPDLGFVDKDYRL